MNPIPFVIAMLKRRWLSSFAFAIVIAVAVALGVAISAEERALREGSARAADRFDLIVAAPGSTTDLLLSVVYLDPRAVELLSPAIAIDVMARPEAELAAPIGFGDRIEGDAVVGTTAAFVDHLSGGLLEGRVFGATMEAVVGALSPHALGEKLHVNHGEQDADDAADDLEGHGAHDHEAGDEGHPDLVVVGRMKPTGTPWNRAIITPIEYNWLAHGLALSHGADDTHIGPPFDAATMPPVPVLVVKPRDIAGAYGLRSEYRTSQSTAFFPAEVLTELYAVLGNVTAIMSGLTFAAQILVLVAILAGIVAILDGFRQRFAILRALGASRLHVFAVAWLYVATLVVGGAAAGLLLGWGAASIVSSLISNATGIATTATIGAPELTLVGALVALGLLLSVLPALLVYRHPAVEGLRA